MRTTAILTLILLFGWGAVGLYAQAPPLTKKAPSTTTAPRPNSKSTKSTPEYVDFQGEQIKHNDRTGIGEAHNGVIKDGDTIIHADIIHWNDKLQQAQATGHLTLTDPKVEITAKKVQIDYATDKQLAILTGSVQVTIKPSEAGNATSGNRTPSPSEPSAAKVDNSSSGADNTEPKSQATNGHENRVAEARKYPAIVTCDQLDYLYHKKQATLTGHLNFEQKLPDLTRHMTADKAVYDADAEVITLYGNVKGDDSKGQTMSSPGPVKVSVKRGDEWVEMPSGSFHFLVPEQNRTAAGNSKPKSGSARVKPSSSENSFNQQPKKSKLHPNKT